MSHEHNHTHEVKGKNLFFTIILNVIITVAQIIGGIFSGSLALLSDALHNFSDVVALVIAWWANKLSGKQNSLEKTFGYKRAEILATLFNASTLMGIGVYLIFESIERFVHPQIISSNIVIYLAILGIVFNAVSVLLIKDDVHDNMNIKAAYLHLLTDVMTSVAVLIGGIAMMVYEIFWIDSVITVMIALYLIKSSFGLIMQSSAILMQFAPKDIDALKIQEFVLQNSAIKELHHLHLWQLSDKERMLEARLNFRENLTISQAQEVIISLEKMIEKEFDIHHITFGVEYMTYSSEQLIYRSCKC
ncbi:MAG TPA: cation transporter [Sulfurimonas sp. UBA12504]|nr:MAG: cobalt transporter [Sulfurimonas sp. GWF2_37_8]DAB29981.1 MAG TPA: cation transporter [Sulfurimonas sp. UBA12504]